MSTRPKSGSRFQLDLFPPTWHFAGHPAANCDPTALQHAAFALENSSNALNTRLAAKAVGRQSADCENLPRVEHKTNIEPSKSMRNRTPAIMGEYSRRLLKLTVFHFAAVGGFFISMFAVGNRPGPMPPLVIPFFIWDYQLLTTNYRLVCIDCA